MFGVNLMQLLKTLSIVLDEVGQNETAKKGKFKNLVTEPTITINQKGMKSYEKSFYGEFILTTNEDNPVNFSKDNRRFVVFKGHTKYKNDRVWWDRNDAHLEDEAKMKTCYEYFKNIDITPKTMFNLPKPVSEYEKQLLETNRSSVDMFAEHLVTTTKQSILDIKKSALFEMYSEYEPKLKLNYTLSHSRFSLQFNNLDLKWCRQRMSKGQRYWVIDIEAGKKEYQDNDENEAVAVESCLHDEEEEMDSDFSFD